MNFSEAHYRCELFSDSCGIEKWFLLIVHMFLIFFPFVLREKLIKKNE